MAKPLPVFDDDDETTKVTGLYDSMNECMRETDASLDELIAKSASVRKEVRKKRISHPKLKAVVSLDFEDKE